MAIEFRCPGCGKKLKTGDDKAGQSAKCPQCGTAVTVPARTVDEGFDESFYQPHEERESGFDDFNDFGAPSATSRPPRQVACPMCGTMNDAAATRCLACGEELAGRTRQEHPRNFSAVWQTAFDTWSANLGLNIVAAILHGLLLVVTYIFMLAVLFAGFGFVGFAGNPGNAAQSVAFLSLVFCAAYIPFVLAYIYAVMGFSNFSLHQMSQNPVDLAEVFQPIGRFPAAFLAAFVVGLAILVFMVPGYAIMFLGQEMIESDELSGLAIVLLSYAVIFAGYALSWTFFWPISYAVVDRKSGFLSPMTDGVRIAMANLKLSVLLSLTHAALMFSGGMVCYVGLLFTMPLSFLLFAVAYDRCKGSRVASGSEI